MESEKRRRGGGIGQEKSISSESARPNGDLEEKFAFFS